MNKINAIDNLTRRANESVEQDGGNDQPQATEPSAKKLLKDEDNLVKVGGGIKEAAGGIDTRKPEKKFDPFADFELEDKPKLEKEQPVRQSKDSEARRLEDMQN